MRIRRAMTLAAAGACAVLCVGGSGSPAMASAVAPHYYIELGGTGASAPAPLCTTSYLSANLFLNGGIAVPVCYPASAGPVENGQGGLDLGAPSYDQSAAEGYQNLLNAVESTYHAHTDARLTIVGYSQGAQAADLVLQTIANGGTDIPRLQVDGMLYADPMQPGTGVGAVVPKGTSVLGLTSPGAGPVSFNGIPVARFCIHTDGICDATTLLSPLGYITEHPKYPEPGNIMTQTIAHDGADGIFWYPVQT